MSIETPVIEAEKSEPTTAAIVDPKESTMAKAFTEKFFAAEKKEDSQQEPVVEKKADPVVEKKAEATPVTEKPKSKTAQEFDNQRSEYEVKLKTAVTERDELKAKAFDLENELTQLKEAASSTADYAEIKRKHDELSKTVELLNLQEHPKFKQKYGAQEQYLFKQVDDLLTGVENKDKIVAALKLSKGPEREAKLDELKQDLGITKISNLAVYEARLNELNENKNLELSNASIAKRLYQEEQEQMAIQEKTGHQKIFEKYANHVTENDVTYKKRDGDDAFNQNIDSRLTEARRLFHEASPEERAQAMLAAVDRPILLSLIQKLSDELTTATGALNGKIASTPGVSASNKTEPTKPNTFLETMKQAMSS